MTHRSASQWAGYWRLLGISGVLAASMTVGAASAQQSQSNRSSDRSSEQDESTRRRDESNQTDESSRSSRNQTDQRRRSDSQTAERDQAPSAQDRSSQNRDFQGRAQQDTQFGERSQYGQGRSSQNQTGQNQYGQSRSGQDQYSQQNRSASTNERRGQSYRDDQYSSQRGGQQYGQTSRSQSGQNSDGAWLGVYLRESQTNEQGAQVTQIYPAGPAARAGLRSGDVITAVDGERVNSTSELIEAIEKQQPGARAQLSVTRNNQQVELPITLGSRQSYAWNRADQQWGGQQEFGGYGQSGGYATSSRSGNEEFRHSRSGEGEDDYWDNVPPFAMQLEHERRMYEQHQRIETQIAKLQEEIRQLREELRQRR